MPLQVMHQRAGRGAAGAAPLYDGAWPGPEDCRPGNRAPLTNGLRGEPSLRKTGAYCLYGPDRLAALRRSVLFVDKILKGAKPGDLPIEQPMKFKLVVNLKTAKALGLTIPPTLLFQADEVIR